MHSPSWAICLQGMSRAAGLHHSRAHSLKIHPLWLSKAYPQPPRYFHVWLEWKKNKKQAMCPKGKCLVLAWFQCLYCGPRNPAFTKQTMGHFQQSVI